MQLVQLGASHLSRLAKALGAIFSNLMMNWICSKERRVEISARQRKAKTARAEEKEGETNLRLSDHVGDGVGSDLVRPTKGKRKRS